MGAPQISLDCKGALSWSTQSGKTRGRLDESWCQQKRKFHREVRGDGAWRRGACRLREAWETSHSTAYTSSSDCMAPSTAGVDSHPHAFTHLFSPVQISFPPGISSEPCEAVFSLRPTDQESESPRPVPPHSSHLCHLLPELHGLTQPGSPLG